MRHGFMKHALQIYDEPKRCMGKDLTDMSHIEGTIFGYLYTNQYWGVVLWDENEDPDMYKMSCLLIEQKSWEGFVAPED